MSFEWENGRILKKINTSDSSIQMSYDSNGMRTQKTKVPFKYNGKEWMIWMWRGRYGITIGAEIGVYIFN